MRSSGPTIAQPNVGQLGCLVTFAFKRGTCGELAGNSVKDLIGVSISSLGGSAIGNKVSNVQGHREGHQLLINVRK